MLQALAAVAIELLTWEPLVIFLSKGDQGTPTSALADFFSGLLRCGCWDSIVEWFRAAISGLSDFFSRLLRCGCWDSMVEWFRAAISSRGLMLPFMLKCSTCSVPCSP